MSTPQPPGAREQQPATSPPAAQPVTPSERRQWRSFLRVALLLLALAYSLAFIALNTKTITIHFVFGTARVRLIWEILLLLAIGVLGGLLLSQLRRRRRRD